MLYTSDDHSEADAEYVAIQRKATASVRRVSGGETITQTVRSSDLKRWLEEPMAVNLVVYDVQESVASWVDVQPYFQSTVRSPYRTSPGDNNDAHSSIKPD